tara:strand:+ start:56 stop:268 length:213 start_codon:yes stop_codon:yes gene_type:complete
MTQVGKGVEYKIDGNGILTITVDTKHDFGPSASGKSTIIASSSGNQQINIGNEVNGDDFAFLGLNIYRKA